MVAYRHSWYNRLDKGDRNRDHQNSHTPKPSDALPIRVQGYDYTQAGAYFITICARNRECLWGKVVNGMVQLNETGG